MYWQFGIYLYKLKSAVTDPRVRTTHQLVGVIVKFKRIFWHWRGQAIKMQTADIHLVWAERHGAHDDVIVADVYYRRD